MDEVVEIRVVGEGAAKIVNGETKGDVFRFVAEQAWCVGALDVAEATQVGDESLLAESARLWQAVHAAADFKVNRIIVEIIVVELELIEDGKRDFLTFDADILVAGRGKRSAEVKVSDIAGTPFLARGDGRVNQKYNNVKAGRLGRHVVGNGKSVDAGGATNTELDGVIGVALLLDHGVVVHHLPAPIVWNLVVVDRDESA